MREAHLVKGYLGRDVMKRYLKDKYCNVSIEQINIYLELCEKCSLKKSKGRRGVVCKPLSSSNVMSRGQVDLIDMQVS